MNNDFSSGASTVSNEGGTFAGSAASVEDQAAKYGKKIEEQAAKYGQKVEEQAAKYGQKAVEAIDAGRTSAATGLGNAAAGLRAKADELPGGEAVSGFAHQTADKMSATAGYLRDHDVADIASDVKGFVKAHPTQAIIGAIVVGFLAGRAARS